MDDASEEEEEEASSLAQGEIPSGGLGRGRLLRPSSLLPPRAGRCCDRALVRAASLMIFLARICAADDDDRGMVVVPGDMPDGAAARRLLFFFEGPPPPSMIIVVGPACELFLLDGERGR